MLRKRLITALLVCSVVLLAATGTTTVTRPAAAADPPLATAAKQPIHRIVVLYLENHSFDSLRGYWCDDHPRRCPRGGMPSSVRLSNGAVVKPSHAPDVVPITEYTFRLAPLGPNDAWTYGFQHALNYSQVPLGPVPMVHRRVPPGDHIHWAQARQDT